METLKVLITRRLERTALLIIMLFSSVIAFAQDATKVPDVDISTTSTTTTTTEEWYTNPLYWVVGALLLIILIAVATRGNRRD